MAALDISNLKFDKIEDEYIPCLENTYIKDKQYHLRRKLGSGGYSIVYLAEDRKDNRNRVAIKCVLHDTPRRHEQFAKETALHSAASDIPGVVPMIDSVIEDGLAFLVMAYVPGKDLFEVMVEQRLFSGRDEIIRSTILQLLDTVEELHSRNIFHRDLKPENILCNVTPQAGFSVYIADFGLATDNEESTSFGVGSYYYMLPECLVGSQSGLLKSFSSRAADVWALGIILVNLLTGKNPWKAAIKSEPTFARYSRDARYLEKVFPFSRSTSLVLDRILSRHACGVRLGDIRTRLLSARTFYMTPAQVASAPKTVRLIAAEWMRGVPMHDFTEEDLTNITLIDNITEAQLFDDDNDKTKSSQVPTEASDATAPPLIRENSSGSEGTTIITPESKATRPAEEVPDLPEEQDISESLVRSYEKDKRKKNGYVYIGRGCVIISDRPRQNLEQTLREFKERKAAKEREAAQASAQQGQASQG